MLPDVIGGLKKREEKVKCERKTEEKSTETGFSKNRVINS
jgi:hypothetical protein